MFTKNFSDTALHVAGIVLLTLEAALVAVNAGTSLSTVLNARLPSLLMVLCT